MRLRRRWLLFVGLHWSQRWYSFFGEMMGWNGSRKVGMVGGWVRGGGLEGDGFGLCHAQSAGKSAEGFEMESSGRRHCSNS